MLTITHLSLKLNFFLFSYFFHSYLSSFSSLPLTSTYPYFFLFTMSFAMLSHSLSFLTLITSSLSFTPFSSPIITPHRLVGEVHATLYVILKHCLSFDPFIEEIMDHIRNKKEAPHGRVCMMEFIAVACFEVCMCVCACVYMCVCICLCASVWICV